MFKESVNFKLTALSMAQLLITGTALHSLRNTRKFYKTRHKQIFEAAGTLLCHGAVAQEEEGLPFVRSAKLLTQGIEIRES